jgi:preprotein translocase subunit SecG
MAKMTKVLLFAILVVGIALAYFYTKQKKEHFKTRSTAPSSGTRSTESKSGTRSADPEKDKKPESKPTPKAPGCNTYKNQKECPTRCKWDAKKSTCS